VVPNGRAALRMWPHLRGALILLHIVAVVLAATMCSEGDAASTTASPSLRGGMQRPAWADPTVQAELDGWYAVATSAGVRVSRQGFEDALWRAAVRLMDTRRALLAPLAPYHHYCGTDQSWRMFVAPQRFPSRLWIEVEQAGEYRPIYIARDPAHTWNAAILDHDRMRTLIFLMGWPAYDDTYARWVEWVARQVAVDFPDATRLRTRYARQRSPTPAEARRGAAAEVTFRRTEVVELEHYR